MAKSLYYNVKDLEELYGLDPDAIHRLVIAGKLTECRIRSKTVFKKAEVFLFQPSDFMTVREERRLLSELRANRQKPAFTKIRDQFIRMHYTLINAITKQYSGRSIAEDELISCALQTLVDSTRWYSNAANKERFSAYVSRCIRKALEDMIQSRQPQTKNAPPPTGSA